MLTVGVSPTARSDARRRARRAAIRWYVTPVLSPYVERLRLAACGGHVCQIWRIQP